MLATSRTGPSASVRGRVQVVRQPLDPLPRRPGAPGPAQTAMIRSSGAWKTASWASTARVSARASARRPAAAAQEDPGEAAQRHRHRQVGHHRVRVQEPAQRPGGHRLEVLERPGHRRDQRGGQGLRADGEPDDAEVGVGRAAAPRPGGCRRWTRAGRDRDAGRAGRPAAGSRSPGPGGAGRPGAAGIRGGRPSSPPSSASRCAPNEVASMASEETPKRPPTT